MLPNALVIVVTVFITGSLSAAVGMFVVRWLNRHAENMERLANEACDAHRETLCLFNELVDAYRARLIASLEKNGIDPSEAKLRASIDDAFRHRGG